MNHSRFALLLIVALLTACSGLDRRYLDTTLGTPLELPPDLSSVDGTSEFDLPAAIEGEDQQVRGKVPVLPRIDTLKLNGRGDLYWLSVDEPAESLYQKVKNFWAYEGYGLVLDEPVIGIMETEWVYTEEGAITKDGPWWENLFATEDLSATQDQFRTRIERDQSSEGSRIYITHRGSEYIHEFRLGDKNSTGTANEWGYRASDPELEVEMLSRLMIYLGLKQESVDEQLANSGLFKPRATMELDSDEKSPFLLLLDPYHIAWNRVRHVLEQLNFEIEVSEFKTGFIDEGVFIVNAQVVESPENKGFLGFGTEEDRRERQFTLVLTEEDHQTTRLILEDEKGNFDTSPEGSQFISLLYGQLK